MIYIANYIHQTSKKIAESIDLNLSEDCLILNLANTPDCDTSNLAEIIHSAIKTNSKILFVNNKECIAKLSTDVLDFENVSLIRKINERSVLIGIDALDHPKEAIREINRLFNSNIDYILCQYPPDIPSHAKNKFSFEFKIDQISSNRICNLKEIIANINVANGCKLFYNYPITPLELDKSKVDKSKDFVTSSIHIENINLYTFWLKPGVVFPVY